MRATALIHGLAILDLVRQHKRISYSRLIKQVSASPATLAAILNELTATGYLQKYPEGYSLGTHLLFMAGELLESMGLRDAARSELINLRDATGETAELAACDGSSVVYIDKVESTDSLRLAARLGAHYSDLHVHALGKVVLAFMDGQLQENYYRTCKLAPRTPRTITSVEKLRKEMARIRKEKVAYDIRENRDDLVRVGGPIFNLHNRLEGVICCAAPAFRTDRKKIALMAGLVKKSGRSISKALGYNNEY